MSQLNATIKDRDKQLEQLKEAAGDNAELKKQIDTLTQQNKDAKAAYEKELASVRLAAAVDAELTAAGARNTVATRAVLEDFLKDAKIVDGKVTAKVGEEMVTLAAKVEAMKKDDATGFLFATKDGKYSGWKPGEGGDKGKPAPIKSPRRCLMTRLRNTWLRTPTRNWTER